MRALWLLAAPPPPAGRAPAQPRLGASSPLLLQWCCPRQPCSLCAPDACRVVQQRRRRRPALVAAAAAPPGAGPEAEDEAREQPFSFGPQPTEDYRGRPIGEGEIGLMADPDDIEVTSPVLRADRGGGCGADGAGPGAALVPGQGRAARVLRGPLLRNIWSLAGLQLGAWAPQAAAPPAAAPRSPRALPCLVLPRRVALLTVCVPLRQATPPTT